MARNPPPTPITHLFRVSCRPTKKGVVDLEKPIGFPRNTVEKVGIWVGAGRKRTGLRRGGLRLCVPWAAWPQMRASQGGTPAGR